MRWQQLVIGGPGLNRVALYLASAVWKSEKRYYSAQIFLLGAEFTKVYANRHGSKEEKPVGAERIGARGTA